MFTNTVCMCHQKHWRNIVKYNIVQGDNRETLKTLADNSIDAVVTDPPYGIDFLGKDWDANTGALETYRECLRVLKPGGYILAFSAARTYHHLAVTLEQAGFEIRDQLMWLYASGFPKAQDIGKAIQRRQGVEEYEGFVDTTKNAGFGQTDYARVRAGVEWSTKETQVGKAKCTSPEAKQWAGWKTALKPAHEPICMARKPFKGSTIDNVLEHGVGALNIDATRIPHEVEGRYPSNVLGEVEGYQKFFYCPKVSRKERHIGFENPMTNGDMIKELGATVSGDGQTVSIPGLYDIKIHGLKHEYEKIKGKQDPLAHIPTNPDGIPTEQSMLDDMGGYYIDIQGNKQEISGKDIYLPDYGYIKVHSLKDYYAKWCETNNKIVNVGNNHPTVKPVALMRYLIKLVTPPNSTVLDPFTGSGSTGMAAVELGHTFIGCELDPAYVEIARRRIEAWNTEEYNNTFKELFEYAE